jgi:uncharacterized membrane protein
MSQILIALAVWLHSLGTVVLIGHFLLLILIYLPALTDSKLEVPAGTALSAISSRSRAWMYIALLVFLVTGIYLTLVDPNYLGLGNFGNLWGILMLAKHLLVLGMIAMGFWFNAILRVGPLMSSNSGSVQAIARFRWYSTAMAVLGILILFFTAFAQTE